MKPGNDDVAGDGAEARVGVELRRLFRRAPVVPQDAGAERPVGAIEERGAVHLAGEADAAHALSSRRDAPLRAPSSALDVAAIQLSGSCSDQPGCGRSTLSGSLIEATIAWLSSISTALTDDVPMSMPIYMAAALKERAVAPVSALVPSCDRF